MGEQQPIHAPSARLALVGGWLVVAGCILLLVTAGLAAAGQPVTIGSDAAGGVVLAVALAVVAGGFALLALGGPSSIGGVSVRIGLGLLALGLAGVVVSSVIGGRLASDPLEELAFVVPFLAGGFAVLVGTPLTIVGLLLRPGTPRRLAAGLIGGLAVIVVAGTISNALLASNAGASSVPVAATLVATAGLGLVLLSVGGLGVTAIRAARGPEAVPA